MGQLTNLYVSESYQGLIKLANSTTGVTGTLQYTQDGVGNNLPIQISTSSVNITGSFTVNGLPIIAVNTGSLMTTGSVSGNTLTFTKGDGSTFPLTVNTGSLPAGVVSGSAQVAAFGYATTSSVTSLSSSIATTDLSQNNRLTSIEGITGSLATTSSLTSLSQSIAVTDLGQNNRLGSLETATGSLQNQINQKLDTGSFNSYTSSNDSKVNSLIASTGSYATTSSVTSLSQSIALTDLNQNNTIATLATTGSNVFQGLQTISGSLIVTGSITALSASITYLQTVYQTSSIIFSSGSNILGDEAGDTQTLNGQVNIPLGNLNVTGATTSSLGFFGNLQGTASFATNALSSSHSVNSNTSISSSYSLNSTSASFAQNSISSSHSINSNTSISSSFAQNAVSSSHSVNSDTSISSSYAQTASFASNGGVTQLLAGPNITISPLSGKGQVTISSTGTGTGSFNTATGSYGSFYDTTTQINPVANTANSMSFNETAITNGVAISGSISPFNTYIKTENAGVYNIQFSAQVDKTDGGTDSVDIWIRKNGTDLLDTATTVTLNNNNDASVAAWNWFVQSAANDYYQIIWASADTDMRLLAEVSSSVHPGIPSVIATANRIDQFLSNTGSFNGDFNGSFTGSLQGTASFATNALSASYAPSVAQVGVITTGSIATTQVITGSLILGNTVISGSLIGSSVNNGLIKIQSELNSSSSLSIPFGYISSSNPNEQTNLIFASSTSSTGSGLLTNNQTGSIVISGSNNIILNSNRTNTIVTFGSYGYIGGGGNIGTTIPTLGTGSVIRPTINNNALQAGLNLQFTTSSLAAPSIASNLIYGSTTINHNSGSIAYSQNISVNPITSTANNIPLPFQSSINGNYFGSTALALNHISSSITLGNNIIAGGNFTVTNLVSSSVSTTNNGLGFSNNLVIGSANGVWVSGSNTSARRNISSNIIGGINTAVSSSQVGADRHLVASIVYGQDLIVSASHTSTTIGGSTFLGRYNDTGSLALSQDVVFAVGTGTGTSTRRTGLYVTSGSLVGVSGSLQVIGNTTMTGSLNVTAGITGSLEGTASYATQALTASFALNGGGGGSTFPFTGSAVITGSLEVIGNTNFTGSVNISSSLANALNVSGTMNVQRIQLDTSPFVVGTLSNLGAIRFNSNTEFNISNYDKTLFPTGAYIDLTTNTGSNFAEIHLYAKYGGVDFDGVKISNYNGSTVTTITTDNTFIAGNTTMTGSLTISGSANPELTVVGNTILTGSVQGNVNALSISSNTASLDLNNGNFFTLQLVSGSATHINPSNIKPGQTINILLSTTGSGTVNFPSSVKQVSGSSYVPTTTTSKDIITLISFDSSSLFLANVKNLV